MQVSIVIPIYRRTEWIGRCLEALAAQDFSDDYEVVIVDDGSPNGDEIRNLVEVNSFSLPFRPKFFRKSNAGPAAARNYGALQVRGEIVCFIDDDSIPDRCWLAEITRPFRETEAGLASGRTCSYYRDNPLPLLLERTVYEGKSFATCNIAYRKKVFDALGGFDEGFPLPSWEDNDLGLRARWAGYSHAYCEDAIVYHPHEVTLDEYREKCRINGKGCACFSLKYLKSRPFWGIGAPFIMSRRLVYCLMPTFWRRQGITANHVKFLWSYYSLRGFICAIADLRHGKN